MYAVRAHGGQGKKGTGTPYIAHVMDVTALVVMNGGQEDHAKASCIAALGRLRAK